MEVINQIKETIHNIAPNNAEITKIEMEGPEIAIYTKNPKAFFENDNLVSKLSHELKKMMNIRTDKSLLMDKDEALEKIKEIIPVDAGIKDITFNECFSEAVIEALKPGLVIGKGGETSKRIILETGWTPNIVRAPTQESEILTGLRHHLNKYSKERKEILKQVAERIYRDANKQAEWVRIGALGGFQEVGRSCMLVETPQTKVLLDCGLNVSNATKDSYPFLETLHFPLSELDAVIISHAHMDHCGFLPYLFKMGYKGPVYSTLPTRDLMTLMQFDFIDVLTKEGRDAPYSERDVKEMLKYCIPRDYRKVTDIAPDMRLTLHNAAHILGSASVHLHIGEGDHNLVYSGDIKYGFVRLFDNIDLNYPRLETLIIESTYGGKSDYQPNREIAEKQLFDIVKQTIDQGGNVLIPVFAVGRGQEIMLVIENFFKTGLMKPKCYVDGMTNEASAVHTAYPEYLREKVKRRILQNDSPFISEIFKNAKNLDRKQILEDGGSVIIASSGMLTGGSSYYYFKELAEDPKNTLIFVGFQAQGTTGRKIQEGIKELPITDSHGRTKALKINMRIETVDGFSGHSDILQLLSYLKRINPKPKRVLVNHGEKSKAIAFSQYISQKMKIPSTAMRNLDMVRLK
ncbi:MAG: beta-CASP ribonuclease aCPSF1 [Candidatus Diapherotrites archaeon]|nr:beta-CASP ribonuclease aCPSF1 [Candidatus Diapherotrites archaeon]